MNKGRTDEAPYPHRGDRGGDTLKQPKMKRNEAIVLEKKFEPIERDAPFHQFEDFWRVPTTI